MLSLNNLAYTKLAIFFRKSFSRRDLLVDLGLGTDFYENNFTTNDMTNRKAIARPPIRDINDVIVRRKC